MSDENLEIQDSTITTKKKRPRDDDLFLDPLKLDLYLPNLPQPQQAFLGNQNFSLAASDVSLSLGMPFAPATSFSPPLSNSLAMVIDDSVASTSSDLLAEASQQPSLSVLAATISTTTPAATSREEDNLSPLLSTASSLPVSAPAQPTKKSDSSVLQSSIATETIIPSKVKKQPSNNWENFIKVMCGPNSLYTFFLESFDATSLLKVGSQRSRTETIKKLIAVTLQRLNKADSKPLGELIFPDEISAESLTDSIDFMTVENMQELAHFMTKEDMWQVNLEQPSKKKVPPILADLEEIENRDYFDISTDSPLACTCIRLINLGEKPAYEPNTLYVEKDTWVLHWYDPLNVSKKNNNFCSKANFYNKDKFAKFFASYGNVVTDRGIVDFQTLCHGHERATPLGKKCSSLWNIIGRWRIHHNKTAENRPARITADLAQVLGKSILQQEETPIVQGQSPAALPFAGTVHYRKSDKKHAKARETKLIPTVPGTALQPAYSALFFEDLQGLALLAKEPLAALTVLNLFNNVFKMILENNSFNDLEILLRPDFYPYFTDNHWQKLLKIVGERLWLPHFIFRDAKPAAPFIIHLLQYPDKKEMLVKAFIFYHSKQPEMLRRFLDYLKIDNENFLHPLARYLSVAPDLAMQKLLSISPLLLAVNEQQQTPIDIAIANQNSNFITIVLQKIMELERQILLTPAGLLDKELQDKIPLIKCIKEKLTAYAQAKAAAAQSLTMSSASASSQLPSLPVAGTVPVAARSSLLSSSSFWQPPRPSTTATSAATAEQDQLPSRDRQGALPPH